MNFLVCFAALLAEKDIFAVWGSANIAEIFFVMGIYLTFVHWKLSF